MLSRFVRLSVPTLLILILASAAFALTATNTVAPSSAGVSNYTITTDAISPVECADLNLSSIIMDGGGTNGNDLILGTEGSDFIHGGNQDDCIIGGGGDDIIFGGGGDDIILGGPGSDIIFGGGGDDICLGQEDGAFFVGCEVTD